MQFPPPCPNGAFAIHKIYIDGFKSKVSAYYEADGRLADAEFIIYRGTYHEAYSRPVKSLKALEYLAHLGQQHKPKPTPQP